MATLQHNAGDQDMIDKVYTKYIRDLVEAYCVFSEAQVKFLSATRINRKFVIKTRRQVAEALRVVSSS